MSMPRVGQKWFLKSAPMIMHTVVMVTHDYRGVTYYMSNGKSTVEVNHKDIGRWNKEKTNG